MKNILKMMILTGVVVCSANLFGAGGKIFSYRSFNPEFAAMKRFADAGVDMVAFLPANTTNSLGDRYSQYPNIWTWFVEYHFEVLDKQFDDILAVNPNAKFVCIVDFGLRRSQSVNHFISAKRYSIWIGDLSSVIPISRNNYATFKEVYFRYMFQKQQLHFPIMVLK